MTTLPSRYTYQVRAVRVRFHAGALEALPEELERIGLRRALVLSTPSRRDEVEERTAMLGDRRAGLVDQAELHVPEERVSATLDEVRRLRPDVCVAIGGGSTIGLAKAVAVETELPIVAIPTTYSGSEMTTIWGVTGGTAKRTGRDRRAGPRVVLYDPALTADLPEDVRAASGMNAIAHAVEALYAVDANPVASLFAADAIRRMAAHLPTNVRDVTDAAARTEVLQAAHLAGRALDITSMALHHKLCHVLGGSFGLPHAATHAVVLPHVTRYNAAAAAEAMATIADALGAAEAWEGLRALLGGLGIATSLRELGLAESDLDRAADLAVQQSYPNPREVTRTGVRELLQAAFDG